ncbi:50S ribosomal protein L9, partial [Flavobacteriaceae bacterium]|nr:50S ribosomal protein L9 [Flavobacteriaceae bacterium]
LFGSISNADLASAISSNGDDLDKKFITLPGKTIKRLGKYEATIRLHREVSFEFPFEIVPETKA